MPNWVPMIHSLRIVWSGQQTHRQARFVASLDPFFFLETFFFKGFFLVRLLLNMLKHVI